MFTSKNKLIVTYPTELTTRIANPKKNQSLIKLGLKVIFRKYAEKPHINK